MEKYIFILGRDPELSQKELLAYLDARKKLYEILEISDIAMILQIEHAKPSEMIKDLAGTQKIAQIIESFDNLYMGTKNKVRYAISRYGEKDDNLKDELKAYFKKEGIKSTIKKSHHQEQDYLNPSEAQNIIEIIQYKGNVANVVAVFNPKDYKFRDTKRPAQRHLHTISIRLAKILINLSGAKQGDTILDPFCGIGTLLQEALIMKIDAIGGDNEKSCIDASKSNLDWIQKHYQSPASYRLVHTDARKINQFIQKVDCVATEPYLGPFIKNYPTEPQAKRIARELLPLYQETIQNLRKITKKNIVFITPRFRTTAKKEVPVNLAPFLEKNRIHFEGPFLYSSPTSKMLREIWIIKMTPKPLYIKTK